MRSFAKTILVVAAGASLSLVQACGRTGNVSQAKDEVNPHGNDQAIQVTVHAPASRVLPNDENLALRVVAWCLSGPTCAGDSDLRFAIDTSSVQAGNSHAERSPIQSTSNYAVNLDYHSNSEPLRRFRAAEGTINSNEVDLDVYLRRIDIHHMTIARPNGTTYLAHGTAAITRLGDTSAQDTLIGEIDTNHGLDVGDHARYRVDVSAQGEDGPKSYSSTLDFTH